MLFNLVWGGGRTLELEDSNFNFVVVVLLLFSLGVTVVAPSTRVYRKMLKTLENYQSSWDYTDQVADLFFFYLYCNIICPITGINR